MTETIDREKLLAECRAYRERTETLEAENADLKAALALFGVTETEGPVDE